MAKTVTKLNGSQQVQSEIADLGGMVIILVVVRLKGRHERIDHVLDIHLNFDKDVKTWNGRMLEGHQTRVAVMNQQVGSQGLGPQIINAAGSVRDIAQDRHLLTHLTNHVVLLRRRGRRSVL